MTGSIVSGVNLCRRYAVRGHVVSALCGVSVSLAQGEFLSLRGRSGSGKSTLLTLLGLMDAPTSGEVSLAGMTVDHKSAEKLSAMRRRHVGFLLQDAGVIERMSVIDNVMLPLRYAGIRNGRAQAMEALEKVGLAHLSGRSVGQLSGGERQRTGLARAIVHQPDLIVCDEPSGALDLENTHIVAQALQAEARRGAGILVATHDPVLDSYCDRRLELDAGALIPVDQAAVQVKRSQSVGA